MIGLRRGVELSTSNRTSAQRVLPDPGSYVWQEGASVVAEFLATGREPLMTAEHAWHVLEIIEAARASPESGRRILLASVFKWPVVVGT